MNHTRMRSLNWILATGLLLLTQQTESAISSPFVLPTLVNDNSGTINARLADYNETAYDFLFNKLVNPETQEEYMYYITGYLRNQTNLKIAGRTASRISERYDTSNCFLFGMRANGSNLSECEKWLKEVAELESCKYLKMDRPFFNITYKADVPPDFTIQYHYIRCSGEMEMSRAKQPIGVIGEPSTIEGDTTTILPSTISAQAAISKRQSTTSMISPKTTIAAGPGRDRTESSSRLQQSGILIPVIVASVLLGILILLAIFCCISLNQRKREARDRQALELMKIMEQNQREKRNIGDDTYCEIAPVLPPRNLCDSKPATPIFYGRSAPGVYERPLPATFLNTDEKATETAGKETTPSTSPKLEPKEAESRVTEDKTENNGDKGEANEATTVQNALYDM